MRTCIVGAAMLALVALAAGCAGNKATIKGNSISTDYTSYTIKTPPPPAWKRIDVEDCDAGFFNQRYSAVITVNSTCKDYQDASPEVLTRHLLFGIENQKINSRKAIAIAGREGLLTDVSGTLDGVPNHMKLMVVNRNYCTYDIILVTPPDSFDEAVATYDAVVASFNVKSSK